MKLIKKWYELTGEKVPYRGIFGGNSVVDVITPNVTIEYMCHVRTIKPRFTPPPRWWENPQ
jgi:hypothetical protein